MLEFFSNVRRHCRFPSIMTAFAWYKRLLSGNKTSYEYDVPLFSRFFFFNWQCQRHVVMLFSNNPSRPLEGGCLLVLLFFLVFCSLAQCSQSIKDISPFTLSILDVFCVSTTALLFMNIHVHATFGNTFGLFLCIPPSSPLRLVINEAHVGKTWQIVQWY